MLKRKLTALLMSIAAATEGSVDGADELEVENKAEAGGSEAAERDLVVGLDEEQVEEVLRLLILLPLLKSLLLDLRQLETSLR